MIFAFRAAPYLGVALGLYATGASADTSQFAQDFKSICIQSDAVTQRAGALADESGWTVLNDHSQIPGNIKMSSSGILRRKTNSGGSYYLILDVMKDDSGQSMWTCFMVSTPAEKDVRTDLRDLFSAEPMMKVNIEGGEAWGWTFVKAVSGDRALLSTISPESLNTYRSNRKSVVMAVNFADRSVLGLSNIPPARASSRGGVSHSRQPAPSKP